MREEHVVGGFCPVPERSTTSNRACMLVWHWSLKLFSLATRPQVLRCADVCFKQDFFLKKLLNNQVCVNKDSLILCCRLTLRHTWILDECWRESIPSNKCLKSLYEILYCFSSNWTSNMSVMLTSALNHEWNAALFLGHREISAARWHRTLTSPHRMMYECKWERDTAAEPQSGRSASCRLVGILNICRRLCGVWLRS